MRADECQLASWASMDILVAFKYQNLDIVQFLNVLRKDAVFTTQETTAMLFVYTNATLLLKWSKEPSDVWYRLQTQVSKGKKSDPFFECFVDCFLKKYYFIFIIIINRYVFFKETVKKGTQKMDYFSCLLEKVRPIFQQCIDVIY